MRALALQTAIARQISTRGDMSSWARCCIGTRIWGEEVGGERVGGERLGGVVWVGAAGRLRLEEEVWKGGIWL